MRLHLVNALVRQGYRVDLVLGHDGAKRPRGLDRAVPVFDLGTSNAITGVPRLAVYLRRRRPAAMLGHRVRVTALMHRARRLSGVPVRLYSTINTHLTSRFEHMPARKAASQQALLRHYYPRNEGVLAISQGVAADVIDVLGLDHDTVPVLPNPVLTPELPALVREPPPHPWLTDRGVPVIMGMGRLQPQKDFHTLLRAFARLSGQRDARLIILGEGDQRESLLHLAAELGVADNVDLPGFMTNPYPWLAHADAFALSSTWEGLGNALIEAMAVGTPVVATDCRSGPAETLDHGRHGPLVPTGDCVALADGIERVLREPPDADTLSRSVARYDADISAVRYALAMELTE